MKLGTFEYKGEVFAGVVTGGKVRRVGDCLTDYIKSLGGAAPKEGGISGEIEYSLKDLKILSPIPEPEQDVLCLGMNYADHSTEAANWGKEEFVKNEGMAVFFSKRASYVIGPGDMIDGHFDIVDGLDYECELAVILGKDAKNAAYEDAFDCVLGYSVFNDVSARNLQKGHKQWYFGKSLDTFCAMGPYIVTKDELPQPPELGIRCYINGEMRQDSNTRFMLYDIAHVISTLSKGMTLKAGTIIAMGTPAGVGMGFDPPKYLAPGDVVRCEIDGIGTLENTVK